MTSLASPPTPLWTLEDELDAFSAPQAFRLPTHLDEAPPSSWLWCFRCERAFELAGVREAHDRFSCAYEDCDAAPLDFWQWDAYRALVGNAAAPAPGVRFPLAVAA